MIEKPTRIVDKKLIKHVKSLPCLVCNRPAPSDAHHIVTKGAGGHDTRDNLVPLCRGHHEEVGSLGRSTFARKHVEFYDWLRFNCPDILLKELL